MSRNNAIRTVALTAAAMACCSPCFGSGDSLANRSPLSASDLIAATRPIRSFRAKNVFDTPPKVDLEGRPFSVDLPVQQGSSLQCVSMPAWRYDATTEKLQLIFPGGTHVGSEIRGYNNKVHPILTDTGIMYTVPVTCNEVRAGYYRVHNAYGVSSQVSRRNQLAVEIVARRDIKHWDEHAEIITSVDVAPADARAMTASLRLRYEGHLTNWMPGSSVACGVERNAVDMNAVWETISDLCLMQGWITHVAFVDGRNNKILAEYTFTGETS